MLRSVIRLVVAMAVWAALSAVAAHAQSAPSASNLPSGDDHYQFNQIDDGYLRLDLKTGEVSQCKARPAGWSCLAVPDERAAFDGEIARLQDENAALKKALLDHGLPLPGGVAPLAATRPPAPAAPPPVARSEPPTNPDLKLPSDADIDRMMAVVEKMWRRLVEMMINLQKDLMKKT